LSHPVSDRRYDAASPSRTLPGPYFPAPLTKPAAIKATSFSLVLELVSPTTANRIFIGTAIISSSRTILSARRAIQIQVPSKAIQKYERELGGLPKAWRVIIRHGDIAFAGLGKTRPADDAGRERFRSLHLALGRFLSADTLAHRCHRHHHHYSSPSFTRPPSVSLFLFFFPPYRCFFPSTRVILSS
jgi:hypothetical protein